jgi:hypothetical protein
MKSLINPFSPGAGSPPPELAGRMPVIEYAETALHRLAQGRHSKSMILVGLRGVGKTVILNRIHLAAEEAGYQASFIEAREGKSLAELLLPALRQVLYALNLRENMSDKTRRALRALRSFLSSLGVKAKAGLGDFALELAIDKETGLADSGDFEADLSALLQAVGEAAAERKRAIALCIDEIQYLHEKEFGALIMALHRVAQRRLPLALMGAGLPQVRGLAGRSKSYSERLFDYPEIGPLNFSDAVEALQKPVRIEGVEFSSAALEEIYRVTEGYPYFLQQWGHEAWNVAAGPVIEEADIHRATKQSIKRLDESFFRVRFDRLTPKEKDYLRALADMGPAPHRSGEIAARLGAKIQAVAPLRNALIRKGMIYSPLYGETAFTVPLFDAFMRRAMPIEEQAAHFQPGA